MVALLESLLVRAFCFSVKFSSGLSNTYFLCLKHLKTTLGMEVLRGKTPSMVRKEIYVFLLAYNLLRGLMWSSGATYGTPPLRLSWQGTRHHLDNFTTALLTASSTQRDQIYRTLLKAIVHKSVISSRSSWLG
jgi:hypothetical protein